MASHASGPKGAKGKPAGLKKSAYGQGVPDRLAKMKKKQADVTTLDKRHSDLDMAVFSIPTRQKTELAYDPIAQHMFQLLQLGLTERLDEANAEVKAGEAGLLETVARSIRHFHSVDKNRLGMTRAGIIALADLAVQHPDEAPEILESVRTWASGLVELFEERLSSHS